MEFTIERSLFLKALSHSQSVIERRTTVPILSNILLNAQEGGTLEMLATDLELSLEEKLKADVKTPGAITVPAHMLYDIVRKLPEGADITLVHDAEKSQVAIKAARSNFKLGTLPAEDFASIQKDTLPHSLTLDVKVLRSLLERTRFAISTEETRYYLNGIYLHTAEVGGKKILKAVATDGHRLAQVEVSDVKTPEGMPGVIIPRKTVNELLRILEHVEGKVEVSLSETNISFSCDGILLTSRLIDGTFPDYEKVIPDQKTYNLTIPSKKFSETVDRVAIVSGDKLRVVKIALAPKVATLSATSLDHGSAVEEMEAEYKGDKVAFGLNSRFILDVSQIIQGAKIEFAINDPGASILIRDSEDHTGSYVIMPLRV
ncbi:MAG: DNA polymerase III subunit beta [Alphaproteobacteria bacterium]|jgi:DNA polymerase III subunit beta|nr:DNA polymerase III subunit beta [Alphaproteobacteria bacterium]MBT5389134.1 DNA polymerase III subunit beta [Alphaproteobacteria bacterium]MBT5540708.1 DNA polymerase III subunit beta [Alphaproteobacteria bacterium]MBT5654466.1 DNA polymerase III subunit beta [Alphaproteobacteria bacterium]